MEKIKRLEKERNAVGIDVSTEIDIEAIQNSMDARLIEGEEVIKLPILPFAYTEQELAEKEAQADIIAEAVIAATQARARKGATANDVRQAARGALGVSPQVDS